MSTSLRFFERLLAPGRVPVRHFRKGSARGRPCILYTDAMWKARRGGIGLILLVPRGDGGYDRHSASGNCPEWLLQLLMAEGSSSIINELEFLAVLCAHLTFGKLLQGQRVIHFIDNTTALSAAVNGRATSYIVPLEDDSDDDPEDAREYLDFAKFPEPDELSSDEEGGGEEGGEEGSDEGGEEESEDSQEDVPLAQRKRKVAQV
ncbi:hypothetical protein T484DRAFT_1839455 [Baffinella frigidus]|nr:hypothetical protein T484DRAFT_1839455 [Cryptophyta sp. CCMP2293]